MSLVLDSCMPAFPGQDCERTLLGCGADPATALRATLYRQAQNLPTADEPELLAHPIATSLCTSAAPPYPSSDEDPPAAGRRSAIASRRPSCPRGRRAEGNKKDA